MKVSKEVWTVYVLNNYGQDVHDYMATLFRYAKKMKGNEALPYDEEDEKAFRFGERMCLCKFTGCGFMFNPKYIYPDRAGRKYLAELMAKYEAL